MYKKHIIGLLALCCTGQVAAQSVEQAKQLFQKGEFEKAKPVFQKLVKQAPSNASYNYWYGACCYETGDKKEAQPYLEKSAARKVIDAYRYLGKLYYDLYRFDDAVDNYEEHIEWLEKKKRPTEQAEAELDLIRQAARMIKGVENVTVVDSFVVDKQRFLDAYRLSREAGTVSLTDERAGSVYVTEMENKQLFADRSGEGPMQLYSCTRLLNGWSDPEPLASLNEQGNVNYPFLLSDGITLYYASDGEGSLGGYDIFVTRYDSEDGTYLRPDNIGMPFNSPANDYMYAIDDFNNIGWFASDRWQPEDKVCVYVFVPNESKEVYDYENTDEQVIIDAATLRSIQTTWKDEEKVRQGKQRLSALLYAKDTEQQKAGEFTLIVDDSAVYHTWSDFRSAEARKLYQQTVQKEKDYAKLRQDLSTLRDRYAAESRANKHSLAPSILDLEQRAEQLRREIDELSVKVRNEEIKKLKH